MPSCNTTRGKNKKEQLDITFESVDSLKLLPKLIFGLLKSPLLSLDGIHPDNWTFLHCLYTYDLGLLFALTYDFSGIEPQFLRRAVLPEVTAVGALNTLSYFAAAFITRTVQPRV